MIAILALAVGLLAGLAAGGSFRGIGELRLRGEIAVLVLFLVQGFARGRLAVTTATPLGTAVWLVSSVLLAGLLILNASWPGAVVAAAGTLLNVIEVVANGAMPVAPTPGIAVGAVGLATASGGFYTLARPWTLASWVGDVIPLTVLRQTYFLSVGDVLLGVGVAVLIASAMMICADSQEPHVGNYR